MFLFTVVGCDVSRQLLQSVIKLSAEIKQQVTYNTQLLQDLNRRQRGMDRERVGQLPCKLPFNTYDDVQDLEQRLKSKDFYSHLVSYFAYL